MIGIESVIPFQMGSKVSVPECPWDATMSFHFNITVKATAAARLFL